MQCLQDLHGLLVAVHQGDNACIAGLLWRFGKCLHALGSLVLSDSQLSAPDTTGESGPWRANQTYYP